MNKNIRSQVYEINPSNSIQPPSASPKNQTPSNSTHKNKIFNIPLIAKRMNKVQKYVRSFHNTVSVTRSNRYQLQSVHDHNNSLSKLYEYSETLNQSTPKKYRNSVFLSEIEQKNTEKPIISGLIYTALNSKDTISKVTSLNRLQQSYVEMKNSIKVHHRLPRISNSKLKESLHRRDRSFNNVTQEQIDKHIKSQMVEQEGKKYYGDLYLLNKGRDKIMQALETIGRQDGTDTPKIYDKIVHDVKNYDTEKFASEQQTKLKILNERQAKINKMMTNKHMHWNVYYDMLALSKQEKSKLQKGCGFGTRYGID